MSLMKADAYGMENILSLAHVLVVGLLCLVAMQRKVLIKTEQGERGF